MRKPTPMMKRVQHAEKIAAAHPISHSMLDKMIDGREYESLLKYRYENVDLAAEIRKSIDEIYAIRKRPIVCYVANVVKPLSVSVAIDGADDLPFNEMIRCVPADEKELDIVLVTPGGLANQVAKFVNTLRPRFEKVSFILLNQAMSAGTIFSLSGDEIVMRGESQIGPIDPQVRNNNGDLVPAQALQTLVDEIRKRGEEFAQRKQPVPWTDIQILKNMDLRELGNAINSSNYSIKLAEEYLVNYKFKTWKNHRNGTPVTDAEKSTRASEIANLLCDHSQWKNHGHAITREAAWNVCKLKIEQSEKVNMERPMRRMWALFYWIFDSMPTAKLFISSNYCLTRNDNVKK